MPRKVSLALELKQLEQRRGQLRGELTDLLREQRAILLHNNLLSTWCDSLTLMQVVRNPRTAEQQGAEQEAYAALLQREVALMQQLSQSGSGGASAATSSSALDAADVLHPGVETIAPAGDPMAYFRHHMFRPPMPEAAQVTASDLARTLRETTLQASVLLHNMQGLPTDSCTSTQTQLQVLWDRVMHLVMSLIMVGREDIVETMNIINLDTLQPDAEGSLQAATQAAQTVQRLQLTEQQQNIIATGSGLYVRLLEGIMAEREQLQLQFASAAAAAVTPAPSRQPSPAAGANTALKLEPSAAAAANAAAALASPSRSSSSSSGGGSSSKVASGSAASAGAAAAAAATGDSFCSRQAQLEAEHQRMARLQLLMQKEYILRVAGMGWVVGCLTWSQVTRAAALSWPFPVRFSLLAQQIQKQWEQQHQHQAAAQRHSRQRQQRAAAAHDASGHMQAASPEHTSSGGQASEM